MRYDFIYFTGVYHQPVVIYNKLSTNIYAQSFYNENKKILIYHNINNRKIYIEKSVFLITDGVDLCLAFYHLIYSFVYK